MTMAEQQTNGNWQERYRNSSQQVQVFLAIIVDNDATLAVV